MYEALFNLQQRPFAAAPQVDRYFPAAAIEQARQVLVRCIQRAEGAGLVIGPSGTGKTLLCQVLAEQHRGPFEVALLPGANLQTCRALLQAILFELGLPYRRLDDGELRLSLNDHLLRRGAEGVEGLALIVDEAHTLPLRLLEEVRLLTNLARAGRSCVRLVLVGSPLLEERLANPKLESLSQRLSARCYLEPLAHDDTIAYVRAQLTAAGGNADEMLDHGALQAIHRATEGIPRLINQLCDHALLLAFADGQVRIDAGGIEQAWADLQQLPAPWGEARPRTRVDGAHRMPGVIEFGRLAEESETFAPEFESHPLSVVPAPPTESESEANDRLEVIEQQLTILEAEFGPAATSEAAGAHSDPFTEQFVEDEVVIDRYASLDAGWAQQRPHVFCQEGDVLNRLLHDAAPPRDCLEIVAPEPALASPAATEETAAVPAASIEKPEPRSDEIDSDMVVVEDDPHVLPVTIRRPPARREEYRNLFAKLRRG